MLLPITLPCRLARGGEWGRVRGRLEPGRIWGGVIVLCSMRQNAGWGSAPFAPREEQQNKKRNCVCSFRRNGSGRGGGRLRQVYLILFALQTEFKAAVSTRKLGQSGIAACTRVFIEGAPSDGDSQR